MGNRAQPQPPQGIVLLLPDFGGFLVPQLAACAFVDLHLLRRALVEPPPEGARRSIAVVEIIAHLLADAIHNLLQLANLALLGGVFVEKNS